MRELLALLWIGGMLLLAGCGTSAPAQATATPIEPTATATPLPTSTLTPTLGTQDIIHTVQPGDTLFKLAQTYNTTVEAIQQANNLKDPNLIVVGQKLTIPRRSR